MARKRKRASAARSQQKGNKTTRDGIIASFLELLAEKSFEQISLADIANKAGVSLGELRDVFPSTLAILAAHVKAIDRTVLSDVDAGMENESPREQLFDVLMRRLELLAPHKEAVRSLMRSAFRNPPLAIALNALAVRSQQWMLTAANISAAGPLGQLRAQGLAWMFGNVLRTWVNDDDPGLAPTLAALDRALASGQRWSGLLDDICSIPKRCCERVERIRRNVRRGRGGDESVAA
jgi:AcrR family transcriptional regulator